VARDGLADYVAQERVAELLRQRGDVALEDDRAQVEDGVLLRLEGNRRREERSTRVYPAVALQLLLFHLRLLHRRANQCLQATTQLSAISDPKLAIYIAQMGPDRRRGDEQLPGNLTRGVKIVRLDDFQASDHVLAWEMMTTSFSPPATITGRLVTIGPPSADDLPALFRWRSSIETVNMLNFRRRIATYEEFLREFERLLPETMLMMIREGKSGQPVGFGLVYHIDPWDGWLFVGMHIEPALHYQGHGGEALLLGVDALFKWFPVRKIYTEVYEFAGPLLQALHTMGFEEVGYQPDHFWYDDRFWGIYRLQLRREAWGERREDYAGIVDVQQRFAGIAGDGSGGR
jgi:RimJ/RimL family protein N-acetyltransferase